MNSGITNANSVEHAKLIWRGRRGLKELDLLLLPFIENAYTTLTTEQKQTLTAMLESADPDLYSWLLGYSCPANYAWQKMCEMIRAFNQS